MKIKKYNILFLLIIAVFGILALIKLNSVLDAKNLKANINDYENEEVLKTYSVGDLVPFDPVNYRICDDYQSDTCYDFVVTKKNDDLYDLVYSDKNVNLKWTQQNPADVINLFIENWSSNLTVNDSYKYVVSENYKYNFNKARILTKDEYDLLTEDQKKSVVGKLGSGARDLLLMMNPKYTENNELDLNTSEFGFIGAEGQYGTVYISFFPFTVNEQGTMVNSTYIKPLISIDMNNVGNNKKTKYIVNFRQFDLYDTIDFDPVNYRFCDDNYESDTCYSWVVINKDGNKYELYFNNALDFMKWNKKNPVDVIEDYTQNWSNKLILNSKYDVKVNSEYGYYFKGKKARLLTADEYNSLKEQNEDYRERVADYKKLNLIISPTENKFYASAAYTDYTSNSDTMYDLKLPLEFSYVNSSYSYTGFFERTYIKPVIHIDLEDGIDNSEEKERKKYTCRRATKNITLGQINTKGSLNTGDAFDCDVDGTGFNKRFYYVTDLEDNNDYGVLIYNHSVMDGKLYDLACHYDSTYTTEQCNSFAYDAENDPQVNGPKTAVTQLPTTSQWNTRLYNTNRNIQDNGHNVRIENFSYEGKAARLLTLKEVIRACNLRESFKYNDMDNNDSTLPEYCSFLKENLDRLGSYNNSKIANDYWLENIINKDDNSNSNSISSYASSWIITGPTISWPDIYTRSSYEYNNGTGIRPVIEVKKASIDYIDYVNVTYNDEDRITVKEIPKGSKTDAIDSKGKTNYTFKYWSLSKTGEEFDFNIVINTDTTLYAVYELDSYTISYDLDEGTLEIENPTSYTPLSEDITLNNPTKDHYTFIGWTGSNGDVPQTSVTITSGSTGNKSYKANYEINKYDVEFYDDEELLDTQKIEHGKKIEKDIIPKTEKVGYKFIGWREKDSTKNFDLDIVITKSYKLYATFEKIECTLSLKSNMYKVDEEKKEINNVPENEEIEVIKSNLIIEGTLKEITRDNVTIICDDKTKTYKINRIWIPKTGNIVARGTIIFGYIGIVLALLFVIGKQVDINKRLRRRL